MFKAGQEACGIVLAALKKRFFITTFELEIGLKFLSAVGAGHKHSPDVNRKAQLLATLSALLNSVFLHRLKRLCHHFTFKKRIVTHKNNSYHFNKLHANKNKLSTGLELK